MLARQVSDEQLKELAVRTETTNPWYWGIRTLAKVPPCHPAALWGPTQLQHTCMLSRPDRLPGTATYA